MNIKEFAEKYIKAWQQAIINGKIGDFEKLFDPVFILHYAEANLSLEAYMQHIEDLQKSSKMIDIYIKYLIGEANLFALDFKARFKFTDNMPGMPPTKGKEIINHYLSLLHVRDGKVNEAWSNGTFTVSPSQPT
jgi:hypothetical protein